MYFLKDIPIFVGIGYSEITKIYTNNQIPKNFSKKHRLTFDKKTHNSALSKSRIYIKYINYYIKRFKILSSRYRNKHKRFVFHISLICEIYNFQF